MPRTKHTPRGLHTQSKSKSRSKTKTQKAAQSKKSAKHVPSPASKSKQKTSSTPDDSKTSKASKSKLSNESTTNDTKGPLKPPFKRVLAQPGTNQKVNPNAPLKRRSSKRKLKKDSKQSIPEDSTISESRIREEEEEKAETEPKSSTETNTKFEPPPNCPFKRVLCSWKSTKIESSEQKGDKKKGSTRKPKAKGSKTKTKSNRKGTKRKRSESFEVDDDVVDLDAMDIEDEGEMIKAVLTSLSRGDADGRKVAKWTLRPRPKKKLRIESSERKETEELKSKKLKESKSTEPEESKSKESEDGVKKFVTGGKAPRRQLAVNQVRAKDTTGPSLPGIEKSERAQRGMVALKEINRLQKSTEHLVPRSTFANVVKEIAWKYKGGVRFQSSAIFAIQEAAEYYIVKLMTDTQDCAVHRNGITIMKRDIKLAKRLRKNKPLPLNVWRDPMKFA